MVRTPTGIVVFSSIRSTDITLNKMAKMEPKMLRGVSGLSGLVVY